jgi:SpoVK/Ycf46/Vps4 family AAA+-type ATPase
MTASADHVKALLRAHASGDENGFYSVALQMAAQAARKGQNRFADDLKQLIDAAQADRIPRVAPTPVIQPRGELADLVTAEYPDVRLSDMTLSLSTRQRLDRVLHEQRQRDRIERHGFEPIHRLLLVGPPGTGKSMTASALATELSLPLFTIRLDALISKYMGETSTKLRTIFDATARTRAVYLFDEFDALGAQRTAGNDVGEARRILNTFLLFLDDTQPESLVVAATNHPGLLDTALFRRFDAVVAYDLPTPEDAADVLLRRLGAMNTSAITWEEVANHVNELSQAELVRAAEAAAKRAILEGSDAVSTADLIAALDERRTARNV